MDTMYIKSFTESVRTVFAIMVRSDVSVGAPDVTSVLPHCDVSAIISMSGDVTGTAVLCFAAPVATAIVAKFTGSKCVFGSPDSSDALGELANMVCGAAKASFTGKNVSISTPSVVVGPGHAFAPPNQSAWVKLPCSSPFGEFSIVIAIREDAAKRLVA